MITMVMPVHPTDGYPIDRLCPAVICDACERVITADAMGILLYSVDSVRQHHVHKGACDRAFRQASDGWAHLWRDLDEWLTQLAHNYADPITRPHAVDLNDGTSVVVSQWTSPPTG